MVQGLSLSTLTTSGNSGVYGSAPSLNSHFRLMKKIQIASGMGGQCLWHHCIRNLCLTGNSYKLRKRNMRVQAGWLFGGGDKSLDANSERSETANEDILIFFFQLDLATRVQCALNMDEFEIAQQLRSKLIEVETEVIRLREAKKGSSSKSDAQDKAISIIRVRSDLQNAIENENYPLAAELRDKISKMEAESLEASAKALVFENAQYALRLGQKVRHKKFGYRAVVCGMDPVCCESTSWMETAQVEKLSRGPNQPFYQVLVDVHLDPNLLVAYVPEENLLALDEPDMESLNHPYLSFLFYGMDAAGDYIPIKQLREKYNRPRHEVPTEDEDEDEDGGGSGT